MDKAALELPQPVWDTGTVRNEPRPRRKFYKLLFGLIVVYALFNAQGWTRHNKARVETRLDEPFDWFKTPPSEQLVWHTCYQFFGNYECARLEVPLDYAQPHGEKAAIALLKYPSKYPVDHELYKGPILYNPGGPGGSGVALGLILGPNFAQLIGDEYDHIGFDPRGVGFTTPSLNVFSAFEEVLMFQTLLPPPINFTSDALGKLHSVSNILGQISQERAKHVASHVSTALVARDMLAITRAHGRDKLQYWGFSYGTVLGATFAAMFPDNVGRVIVDGVVDSENYYSGAWSNNLIDTDKELAMLYEECANSKDCPLQESTADKVSARVDNIFEKLKTRTFSVNRGAAYGVIDYSIMRSLLFSMLYSPAQVAPIVFRILAGLEAEDPDRYGILVPGFSAWRCQCDQNDVLVPQGYAPTLAIACGDGDELGGSLEKLQQEYASMARLSTFADVWPIHGLCNGWRVRPVERFTGPFVGNTSHPLLFIGNIADPVTPLWAAKKMAEGFKDARVLTQNSLGHCSIAAPSICTSRVVRDYFRNGTLPEEGAECNVTGSLWPEQNDWAATYAQLSTEDASLLSAARVLHEKMSLNMPKLGYIWDVDHRL